MKVKWKSVKVSEANHRRLKRLAAQRGVSIQYLIVELLTWSLANGK